MIKNGIELNKVLFYPTMRGKELGKRWTYPISGYKYVAACGEELVIHRDFTTLRDEERIELLNNCGYVVSHLKSGFGVGFFDIERLKDVPEYVDKLNELAIKCMNVRDYDKICSDHDELVRKYYED